MDIHICTQKPPNNVQVLKYQTLTNIASVPLRFKNTTLLLPERDRLGGWHHQTAMLPLKIQPCRDSEGMG
jgi:hypothetical protein